eukprot:Gregarina_sp_Poly_1__8756@NODE_524_length_7712_cov_88_390582_g415_i0_p5_GENE_NODE_524_length_7712_cov_88_390582_g415_i0NODE_524_length_7712_cov_88_390582_g415_i0_p5_ORF_typecomplete_len112_score23_56_NODE_524_length_7712_cov_88_390582_g415_i069957330
MVQAFPPVTEQAGELVAKFVFTALIFPNGTRKLGGLPLDTSMIKSDKALESPLKELLAQQYGPPSKAKRKKAKKVNEKTADEVTANKDDHTVNKIDISDEVTKKGPRPPKP